MASTLRRTALRGSVYFGAAAVGVGYLQRLPERPGVPETDQSKSFATRIYQEVVLPAVMLTDPEMAHKATLTAGAVFQALRMLAEPAWTGATPLDWLVRPAASEVEYPGPSLEQALFKGRLRFRSPLGIAAGFDKNADLVPLYRVGAVPGLGFSEIGSVSAEASEGNAQPRLFRLGSDEAVINRMGLNNEGAEAIAAKLKSFDVLGTATTSGDEPRNPIGINITKTHSPAILGEGAMQDFKKSFVKLAPFADFVVLNVSCPNTAEGKTFEDKETLKKLLQVISQARKEASSEAPILVKLSPPMISDEGRKQLRELVEVATKSGTVDGFVVSNTAGDRALPLSRQGKREAEVIGKGGLSGRPLRARSTAAIREVFRATGGKVPIIGVGGVDSPEAAYEKIKAGASLVEVYSGLVYKGPMLFMDMHLGLRRLLQRDGYGTISEAIGADVKL